MLLIEPGAIATPIWERGTAAGAEIRQQSPARRFARYAKQLAGADRMAERGARSGLDPSVPAAVILQCLTSRHPKPRQVVGRDAAVVAALVRLLPFRLLYRIVGAG